MKTTTIDIVYAIQGFFFIISSFIYSVMGNTDSNFKIMSLICLLAMFWRFDKIGESK